MTRELSSARQRDKDRDRESERESRRAERPAEARAVLQRGGRCTSPHPACQALDAALRALQLRSRGYLTNWSEVAQLLFPTQLVGMQPGNPHPWAPPTHSPYAPRPPRLSAIARRPCPFDRHAALPPPPPTTLLALPHCLRACWPPGVTARLSAGGLELDSPKDTVAPPAEGRELRGELAGGGEAAGQVAGAEQLDFGEMVVGDTKDKMWEIVHLGQRCTATRRAVTATRLGVRGKHARAESRH